MRSRSPIAALLFGAVVACAGGVAGCGGGSQQPPVLSFSGAPLVTVGSSSGQLQVAVRWSPQSPTVGLDAAELTITDPTGAPVDGLQLAVVPWMPAHGHGTSVPPEVSSTATGVFVATPVDIFMTGSWELRLTTTGTVDDTATAPFTVQ
jgi:hypothetical protein